MFSRIYLYSFLQIVLLKSNLISCQQEIFKWGEVTPRDLSLEMKNVLIGFVVMWENCFYNGMNKSKFISDDTHAYLNTSYNSKESTHLKKNRTFFTNLVTSKEFIVTLESDVEVLRKDLVNKMKYCKNAIFDEKLLKLYYLDSDELDE